MKPTGQRSRALSGYTPQRSMGGQETSTRFPRQDVRFKLVFWTRLLFWMNYPHPDYGQRQHKQLHRNHDIDLSTKPINNRRNTTTATHAPSSPTSSSGFDITSVTSPLFPHLSRFQIINLPRVPVLNFGSHGPEVITALSIECQGKRKHRSPDRATWKDRDSPHFAPSRPYELHPPQRHTSVRAHFRRRRYFYVLSWLRQLDIKRPTTIISNISTPHKPNNKP